MQPDQWLAQYGETVNAAKRRAEQAEAQLGEVGGSASSDDGLITVSVNASGALTNLVLRPGVRGLDPEDVAAAILATATKAQRTASGRVVEIVQEFVGDGPALDFVKARMPHGYSGDGTDVVEPEPELQRRDTRPDDEYFTDPPEVMG
jgi:DNA-binding protein YbaB